MKKFIACLLALLVVAAAVPAFADWGDRLEITFTIGENFVNINGAVTEILDAPYIVDDLPEGSGTEECAEMLLSQLGGEYTVYQPVTDEGDYYTFSVCTEGKNDCRTYESYALIISGGKVYAFHITQDASTFGGSESDEFLAVAKSLEIS